MQISNWLVISGGLAIQNPIAAILAGLGLINLSVPKQLPLPGMPPKPPSQTGEPRVGTQTGDTSKNAAILRRNLENRGQIANPNDQAHHILASTHELEYEARVLLAKLDIDINSAVNGVFLPPEIHRLTFNDRYIEYVVSALNEAEDTKDAVRILSEIAEILKQGLYGN